MCKVYYRYSSYHILSFNEKNVDFSKFFKKKKIKIVSNYKNFVKSINCFGVQLSLC